jgi:hypothetical protein
MAAPVGERQEWLQRAVDRGQFRPVAEARKRIALRIKELQPGASNRKIADVMGVAGRTIDRDVATNVALATKNINDINGAIDDVATNGAPPLSGAAAGVLVQRITKAAETRQKNEQKRKTKIRSSSSGGGRRWCAQLSFSTGNAFHVLPLDKASPEPSPSGPSSCPAVRGSSEFSESSTSASLILLGLCASISHFCEARSFPLARSGR